MKAISIPAPHEIALVEVPAPELKPGWLRLKVSHVGICGTDYHIFEGLHPFLVYPRIIGHELSATVIDANGSTQFKAGDAVIINPYLSCYECPACLEGKTNCCETLQCLGVHTDGGMAEELVLPEVNLYPVSGLSARDRAMVEFLAIGAHAVRRSELKPGSRVVVVGGGPIGLGTAFFARIAGGDVTILDAAADKQDAAREMGFSAIGLEDLETDAVKAVRRSGFDAVFDATGSIRAMNAAIGLARNGGSLTLVGVVKGILNWDDSELHRREMTIRGSRNATRVDFDHVVDSMKAGKIPADRLATHRTDIERVAHDLPLWAHDRSGLIKAIVEIA